MDTDSLYLALSDENLEDVILREKRAEWDQLRSKECTDDFTANATDNFFPRTSSNVHKKHDKREPGLFKEAFRCAEMLCLCSKTYCCYDKQTNRHNRHIGRVWQWWTNAKIWQSLRKTVNTTSTNRGFRTIQHSFATYEQTKKGLSYFYPKRIVEKDGIHTRPLPL